MSKKTLCQRVGLNLVLVLAMLLTLVGAASAAPPAAEVLAQGETTYTVKLGDNLWTLAEKYLNSGAAYWAIVSATNAKHEEDPSFAQIENPGLIYPGWKLLIPGGEALASLDELDEGWNVLSPGGDTICSNGTEFAFYVRPGDTEKLLIYFQGGGACWFGEICDLTANPTYDPFVDETDNPAESPFGIFDLENSENPFADYSMVFVPYCTADVHIGNSVTTYEVAATDDAKAHEVTIYHKGHVNATAVLDWTFENFDPETVFVAGSSAGAIPSPFYAAFVAEQYPGAHIAVLGDAAGGYRSEALPLLFTNWGTMDILPDFPEYKDATIDNLTFETFYMVSGSRYPDITFAQYNTAGDETQVFFLSLVGVTDTPLIELLEANFADINAAVDNFRSYTAGGVVHTILGRPEFYTYQVDGLRFLDWIAALAAGEDIENAMCTDCESAE